MQLVHPTSLSVTLDAVHDAFFHRGEVTRGDARSAARWIATRHHLPGAYAGTFAGTDAELRRGPRLFTGERTTGASARHILGEEACRALILLDSPDPAPRAALQSSTESLVSRLCSQDNSRDFGWYCCTRCSVSVWRHLSVGGLDHQPARLAAGLERLRRSRTGDGRWGAFPFWYTVLTLVGIDLREAEEELRYAEKILARAAESNSNRNRFAHRRALIARRALERI
jgi:hypothetical protein